MNRTMEKAERVRRALAGAPVDRPPISFWWHHFAREHTADELAAETVEQFRRYDWDIIKIQSRATVFAEGWGVRYQPSTARAVAPVITAWPVRSPQDLASVRPLDPSAGVLGEQVTALRAVRRAAGAGVPILQTVFAPAMVLSYMLGGSPDREPRLLDLIRHHPVEAHRALTAIRDTLIGYTRLALENGADGIFFAVKAASADQMTRSEYAEFGLPYDRDLLATAAPGWANMLHLCGPRLYFDVADDLPTPLLNWALDAGNPGLAVGRDRTNRAVIGGVSAKPRIREMSPQALTAEVAAALDDTQGVRVMIGPGCSISPDTPEENLRALRSAVERDGGRRG
ncbi:MAG TPA: uroporphyrinogen decarboxylase family protein [bacterium]|nr:uroporphyrinogen decarboxylase family protein [bacterium]